MVLFKCNITICNFWQFITLGRKNYFFCGNHEATVSISFVCSLLAIYKSRNVAPKDYLNDIISPQYSNINPNRSLENRAFILREIRHDYGNN